MSRNFQRFTDKNVTLVTEDTYFPLVIYTWFGEPSMPAVDEYYRLRWQYDERARKEGTKVVLVTDGSEFKPPPATIRKYLAERAMETDASDALLCYVTCVPSPLLRGVVTAMAWIAGEQLKTNINLGSMNKVLERALVEFEKAGIQAPDVNPESYTPPTPE